MDITNKIIEEFEERFVSNNILDCIPEKNWIEMKGEVSSFIQIKINDAIVTQRKEIIELLEMMTVATNPEFKAGYMLAKRDAILRVKSTKIQ